MQALLVTGHCKLVTEMLLSIHYLPCVQWFSKLITGNVVIEQWENYSKGSYRNRCHIIGANGVLALSIPLEKGKNQQTPIRNVQISYRDNWQKVHWQSIQSAYGNAPFFEFYADDLKVHFEEQKEFLFDFNLGLIQTILELMGMDNSCISFSDEFIKNPPNDFRNGISPKINKQIEDPHFEAVPYAQVFLEKHGFLENVSVLDLLFCAGPEGIGILEGSFV